MKKLIVSLLIVVAALSASAQSSNPFPNTDSLIKYINKWIRNSPVDAFTNLRLNTSLIGITRFLQNSYGGQVTAFYKDADSIKLVTANGDTLMITLASGGGGTDLSMTRNGVSVTINSSTGTDAIIPAATQSNAGVITAADKALLDSAVTRQRLRDSLNVRLRIDDTAQMLAPYARSIDVPAQFNPIQGANISITGTYPNMTFAASGLVKYTDTSAMLANYQSGLNTKISNITGLVTAGSNVTIDGSGTPGSPYVINSTGGGGGGSVTTVSGTTNRITVVNGTTTPVIDIASTYVGQNSITTVGTLTTGSYQATPIANAYLANSSITFATPGTSGTAPNYSASPVSLGGTATLNIPLASATGVTAGLVSKTNYDNWQSKLSPSDTAAMLNPYQVAINGKVNYSDTSGMLTAYRTALNARVRYTDTSAMLIPYQTALNARLQNITNYITAGANVTITGSGTLADPYEIASTGGGGGGTGTVTSFSFTNANGFTGSVSNATTTPALSISLQNAAADGSTKGQAGFTAADFNASAGIISIDYTNAQSASSTNKGFLTSTDWTTFNNKQGAITLTTTGTSGAATLVGNTLNIPQYSGTSYTFTASDFNEAGTTISIDYTNGQAASGSTKGYLTSTDWTTFNNKLSSTLSSAQIFVGNGSNVATARTMSGDATLSNIGELTIQDNAITTSKINANQVTFAKMQAIMARSVLGNATNSGGNVSEIQGTTNQVLRVASDGSSLAFGAINLASSAAVSGLLADANISSASTWNAKQNAIALTTVGTSGAATFDGTTLNIPQYTGGGGGTSYTFSAPLSESAGNVTIANSAADGTTKGAAAFTANDFNASSGVISIDYTNGQAATSGQKGFLTSTDWSTFNGKQAAITLTTTGTSGAATFDGTTLNIPEYAGTSYTFTASDFNESGSTISIDYTNGQAASGSTKGFLTSTDWTTFNNKQATLVSGTNIKTINGNSILGSGDLVISAGESPLTFQHSLSRTGNTINLVNDEASPGANHGYFTDDAGVKGWYETLPVTITSPEDDDILSYQGGTWVNIPMPATGGTTSITFKEVSFTATSGQTTFSHDSLSGKHVRVWREGVKQKVSDTYGYELSGTVITFYPALSLNEDVYVEVSPSSYWGTLTAGDYDSDAQAYFDAVATAGGTLTTEEKDAYNTFVLTGKSEGWYSNLVIFHPILTSTANAHPINSINPSVSGTNNGGITHNNGSVTFNGSSGYVNVGLNMSLTEADKNSLTFLAYVKNNVQADVYAFGMANTGSSFNLAMVPRNTSDLAASIMYDPSNVITNASTNSIGLWEVRRSSSTSFRMYKNNVQQGSTNTAANGLSMPSANVYYGATNVNGTATGFSTFEISCFAITNMGADATKLSQFNSALTTFLATLNKD